MRLVSIGLLGADVEWCEEAALSLMRRASPSRGIVQVDAPGEAERLFSTSIPPEGLFISRRPSAAFLDWVDEQGLPILLVLRDPRDCVAALVADEKFKFDQAHHLVAAGCAAVSGLIERGRATILRYEDGLAGRTSTVEAVAAMLGLSDPALVARRFILENRQTPNRAEAGGVAGTPPIHMAPRSPKSWRKVLDKDQQAAVDNTLSGYAALFDGGSMGPVYWSHTLFMLGDHPNESVIGPIDITGRARCLFYGGYLPLPAGAWQAEVLLVIAPDAVGHSFIFEIYSNNTSLAHVIAIADEWGSLEATVPFTLDTSDEVVQIRVFNERGAIEGRVGFGGAVLTRTDGH